MTENIPQTSASDRYEAARKALAEYDEPHHPDTLDGELRAQALATALRALITPPSAGESETRIAERVIAQFPELDRRDIAQPIHEAIRAGIQSAHETWEPEVALRPTQEQMLRWLGIKYVATDNLDGDSIFAIQAQPIEREEI